MTQAERRAAQAALQDRMGALTREITDALNDAAMTGLYPEGLPQTLRRVLSTNQVAAHEYGPRPEA